MGTKQSSLEIKSFSDLVDNHVYGLFKMTRAIKENDVRNQENAARELQTNVRNLVVALKGVLPGNAIIGDILFDPLNESVKDDVKLAYGIINCHCGLGKYGTCENGRVTRKAFAEIQSNHEKTVKVLNMLLGKQDNWKDLWATQLSAMDNYFTVFAKNDEDSPEVNESKQNCLVAAKQLTSALDKHIKRTTS